MKIENSKIVFLLLKNIFFEVLKNKIINFLKNTLSLSKSNRLRPSHIWHRMTLLSKIAFKNNLQKPIPFPNIKWDLEVVSAESDCFFVSNMASWVAKIYGVEKIKQTNSLPKHMNILRCKTKLVVEQLRTTNTFSIGDSIEHHDEGFCAWFREHVDLRLENSKNKMKEKNKKKGFKRFHFLFFLISFFLFQCASNFSPMTISFASTVCGF